MASARKVAHRALTDLERGAIDRLSDGLAAGGALSERDGALARELALGTERRRSLLDHVLGSYLERGMPKDPAARSALRMGAYQLLYTPGIKAHAAVFETVALVPRHKGLVNAVLRKVTGCVLDRAADPEAERWELPLPGDRTAKLKLPLPDRRGELARYLSVRYGVPHFLAERWVGQMGAEAAEAACEASAAKPEVFLRARQNSGDSLRDGLVAEGVEVEPTSHPLVLRWSGGASPFRTDAFKAGGFVVQDPTAVRAAEAVGAMPGEVVVDLCAAPGTKASLLAEQVGEDGVVLAFDIDPNRRERIAETATRLGLGSLAIVESVTRLMPADRVLVDVPCSNTGVLARRVEVRRRLGPESLRHLAPVQAALLSQGMERVKPGGVVVYSTCSVEPEENRELVDGVLARWDGWTLERDVLTLPAAPVHDGGYFAVLRAPDAAPAASPDVDGA